MELATKNYQNLVNEIQTIIGNSQQKIAQEIAFEKILMAWNIGQIIEGHLLEQNLEGDGVFSQLEEDIAIAKNSLYQMRKFYQTYPQAPSKDKALSWSHYRDLLRIKDDKKRQYFEGFALENNLSSKDLQKEISENNRKERQVTLDQNAKLPFDRGELFIYKTRKFKSSDKVFLDLGFNIFNDIEADLGADDLLVRSIKDDDSFTLNQAQVTRRKLHCYKAYLEKVVDGDTLNVILDLGFNIRHKEIIRLAKINSPERKTLEGKNASQKLSEILEEVPFLIIKTKKIDIFGRYVADVFLPSKGEKDAQKAASEGVYLNQMLLDLGVARVI